MSPVDPRAAGNLTPSIEDKDAGLVGVADGFALKRYQVIIVEPFVVDPKSIQDEETTRLAKDMAAYWHAQLVRKLEGAGIFTRVVDASVTANPDTRVPSLRLGGGISELTEGSRMLRYFVGFGAGATKAQVETRLTDAQTRDVQIVTADRRAAAMGIFGGDSRQFLTESFDQMADGLVALLRHLATDGKPGRR